MDRGVPDHPESPCGVSVDRHIHDAVCAPLRWGRSIMVRLPRSQRDRGGMKAKLVSWAVSAAPNPIGCDPVAA
jgi:hypothetical protein